VKRSSAIEEIRETELWDIVVIGGGATGLGIAVDAAKRGFKILLLEKNDFAKGTSSRSTKLVHGGVRYLTQGNIKLVIDALRERGFLLKNAPHLTRIQQFIIPAYAYWQKWFYGIGLGIYDILSNKLSLGRPTILGKKSLLAIMPSIERKKLKGGISYMDGQFDDARLAISLAQTATDLGATVLNYCGVVKLIKENGKIAGVEATDEIGEDFFSVKSKTVINATGVFVDQILGMDDAASPAMVMPSQGVHLVVDRIFFPGTGALMIPKTTDGRVLFALPWHDAVVIGTTDTPLNLISEEPIALEEEIDFILNNFNQYNELDISRKDILSVFAGLRPLVKTSNTGSTALASRDHTIIVSKSNLLTITGGKWTTYRKMAKDAVSNAAFIGKLPIVKCSTRNLKLHGYSDTIKYGDRLYSFGSDSEYILHMIANDPGLGEKIHPLFDFTKAEVIWTVQNEMAMFVEDYLARRSRMLFLNATAAMETAPLVASIMAKELGRDECWEKDQVAEFKEIASAYLPKV
jgi:glycerol-3-phosphate dehydrogenase